MALHPNDKYLRGERRLETVFEGWCMSHTYVNALMPRSFARSRDVCLARASEYWNSIGETSEDEKPAWTPTKVKIIIEE